MLQKFFKIKNISKKTKIISNEHSTSETWVQTKRDRKKINIFERNLCRKILGPVNGNEKENWRLLTDKEMYAVV
jgi:hypothetical protein